MIFMQLKKEDKKENRMQKRVGLWIDHREAVVITLDEPGVSVQRILSEVEKNPQRAVNAEDFGPFESQRVKADDRRQKALSSYLQSYYDTVIDSLKDADAILIFGPGEAKIEVKQRLEDRKMDSRIVGFETADSMTEPQMVAKTKSYFAT